MCLGVCNLLEKVLDSVAVYLFQDYSPSNNIGDYIPWDDNKQRPMQCEQYVTHGGGAGGNSTAGTLLNGGNRSIVECEHGWIFNKTEYNTVVTEVNLSFSFTHDLNNNIFRGLRR